jgi:hypothetical protein
MGDRANIYLVDTDDPTHGIYLYTHHSGYKWPEQLRLALLAGRGRFGDDQYLARIIVSNVFKDIHDQETGGGLSTVIGDNGYPITIVDLPNRTVSWATEGGEGDRTAWYGTITFWDFTDQTSANYPPR